MPPQWLVIVVVWCVIALDTDVRNDVTIEVKVYNIKVSGNVVLLSPVVVRSVVFSSWCFGPWHWGP